MYQIKFMTQDPSSKKTPATFRVKSISGAVKKHRQNGMFKQLNELVAAMREAVSIDEVLELITEKTAEIVNPKAVGVWLFHPGDQTLRQVFAVGESFLPVQIKPAEGIGGTVFASGQPYFTQDILEDPLTDPASRALVPPGIAAGCFPIRSAQEVIGVFFLAYQTSQDPLAGDQKRLLMTGLEMVGSVIHRFKLEELAKRQMQWLEALRAIDLTITRSLDLENILQVLLDQVIVQLKVDAACVLVYNPYEKSLEFTATRGFTTDALRNTRLRIGEGYAGRAAAEQRTIYVPDLRSAQTDFSRSLSFSAEGFVAYYAVPIVARNEVKGVLEIFHRSRLESNQEWLDFAESLASQAAIALEGAALISDLKRTNTELNLAYTATLEGWSGALDLRDRETEGHSQRVTEMTLRLSKAMGVGESELVQIRRGALLHDIGKLGIPDSILFKSGPLNEAEIQRVQKHPAIAYELLAPIAYLRPALDIPYAHHERWDGSGYPRGLKGEEIPLSARIFAVVDVWDALLTDRPYRKGWPEARVRAYLLEQSGRHFDPQIVKTFFLLLDEDENQLFDDLSSEGRGEKQ